MRLQLKVYQATSDVPTGNFQCVPQQCSKQGQSVGQLILYAFFLFLFQNMRDRRLINFKTYFEPFLQPLMLKL